MQTRKPTGAPAVGCIDAFLDLAQRDERFRHDPKDTFGDAHGFERFLWRRSWVLCTLPVAPEKERLSEPKVASRNSILRRRAAEAQQQQTTQPALARWVAVRARWPGGPRTLGSLTGICSGLELLLRDGVRTGNHDGVLWIPHTHNQTLTTRLIWFWRSASQCAG